VSKTSSYYNTTVENPSSMTINNIDNTKHFVTNNSVVTIIYVLFSIFSVSFMTTLLFTSVTASEDVVSLFIQIGNMIQSNTIILMTYIYGLLRSFVMNHIGHHVEEW
jgi:hypothetical protein